MPFYTASNKDSQFNLFMAAGSQTTTSDTAQNITELVSPTLDANSRYSIMGKIFVGCNNTGGVKLAVDIPASASINLGLDTRTSSATAPLIQTIIADATLNATAFCTQSVQNIQVTITGEIATGASSGVAQFQFAAGVAGQTATIIQLGTLIQFTKIA